MLTLISRRSRAMVALAAALTLAAGLAEARPSGGSSMGSRGSRTYSAPPPTTTAPSTAKPMERSYTQPGPTMNAGAAAAPRRSGFGTGLFAGLLGAGLLGMLFGGGFFGGLGGLASFLGLLLQVALFGGLAFLVIRWFRSRQQPAFAGPASHARSGLGGLGGPMPGGTAGAARTAPRSDAVGIGPEDYKAFERSLGEIQLAYGREDVDALRRLTTQEMAHYFTEELAANASRGLVNRLSEPRLLRGDLSEAWREGQSEYATVAMRYQLNDTLVERASGRVVRGDPATPVEVVEVWTFRRDRGGPWLLSAIQQTG